MVQTVQKRLRYITIDIIRQIIGVKIQRDFGVRLAVIGNERCIGLIAHIAGRIIRLYQQSTFRVGKDLIGLGIDD